ncbi:hypothetical protein D3C81_299610 [compost metagenome]
MARRTDIPRVKNPPSGDGHHVSSRFMTTTELAERDARQKHMTICWRDNRHMKTASSGNLINRNNQAQWVVCSPKAANSPTA